MKQFSDLNIEAKKSFIGSSILMEEVLDKEIIVEDFVIKDSIKKPGTDCMHLQLKVDDEYRVLFTGSEFLMSQIKQLKDGDIPFKAKIIKINRHFEFS